ncbi:YtxH domain-containing protein [Paenibacillus timonensis]|uniref:YtxH domain-containing protein n=1 Tax=Paenibacillus timonensis TaxID=225915 RepID=A0ABW3SE13_9BACL|nr:MULTISPECIES: YtxH domain-containing protein [Paenibacillus]MCH1641015.1 YtxH domain-containing protein [Paenibacillus timonensis]MDU2242741.1 YtxH domain-containing protein [Paenibacillus sp.]
MSKGNKGWLWGAAIGTVAGAVTALLFAPKAGKELRKDIADGARQVGEKTQEVAGKVSEQSTVLVGKVKEAAEGLISEIQSRRSAKDVAEEEVAQVSEFAEDGEPAAEEETVVLGVVAGEETTEAGELEVAVSEAAATAESEEDK